ncbi:MAG: NAD(P)-binding domain-containing protein [Sideroxydans sp.]|nr:NAD(P)-binding domain-containing protein [Sideroxydans sp.]
MNTPQNPQHPIAVLGAGPVGLAAAAHLLERGFEALIIEAGDSVGMCFRSFAQVKLFSPWRYNIDKAAQRLLEANGWNAPDADGLPSAGELFAQYLRPLAATPAIRERLRLNTKVSAITRKGYDKVKTQGREHAPFVIRAQTGDEEIEFIASGVIDATGNWSHPNPLGANGLPAIGETAFADRIEYGMPDIQGDLRERYLGKNVLVVGSGHSAAGSLIALSELAVIDPQTRIHWAIRGSNITRIFGGGAADGLPARGALGLKLRALIENRQLVLHENFRIAEISEEDGALTIWSEADNDAQAVICGIDEIVAGTGSRPDIEMTRELRVQLDTALESVAALAPLIDPNVHSCGTVRPHGHRELAHPEAGFYIAGAKSYGRAPTFLMATGYEQVRSIAAAMAGDLAAADDVQLDLPETGVCSTDFAEDGAAGGCCQPVQDAAPTSDEGCGCSLPTKPRQAAACCA